MAIQPLDLQTLFSHMNQVGRDQAAAKEAAVLQQAQQGNALVKETIAQDHSVNKMQDMEEGPEKTDENEGGKNRHPGKKGTRDDSHEEESPPQKKYYKDPDLGNKIDLSG